MKILKFLGNNPFFYTASYSYDPCGNLLSDGESQYACDYLDQLIAENDHLYAYDALHNRVQKDDQICEFNALCQNRSFTYDTNGNLISDGTHRYVYDSLDRLIGYDDHRFTYDAFDRRMTRDCRQNILSRDGVHLLYNMQGNNRFLIVMDEYHPEMAYALDAQVTAMYSIERDLRIALEKEHPDLAVVTYEQNRFEVGQTVREAHWQVAAYDQASAFWQGATLMLSYETKGPSRISDKEMAERTSFWRAKIEQVAGSQ